MANKHLANLQPACEREMDSFYYGHSDGVLCACLSLAIISSDRTKKKERNRLCTHIKHRSQLTCGGISFFYIVVWPF